MALRLSFESGALAGIHIVTASPSVRLGRDPQTNDILLTHPKVSRRHAVLVRKGSHFTVRDASSLNGTYLRGERIDDEAELEDGDELQIGKFKLAFFHGTKH